MILGLGLDLIEIERIRKAYERFGPRFAQRVLHPAELAEFETLASPEGKAQYLAARFAAKEAAAKALGTGFAQGVAPTDIRLRKDPNGAPHLEFHGPALERLQTLGAANTRVSITHSRANAAAVVVLEKM